MPAFAYNTRLKEVGDDITLAIQSRHILALGSTSSPPKSMKGRLPEDTDIVLRADLVLSFAATVDRHPVSASCLLKSSCLRHVVYHLKSNKHSLGLATVSDLYIDNDDLGVPKVTLSSAWPYRSPGGNCGNAVLSLESIDLTFVLKFASSSEQSAFHVFSERAYLPFMSILDRALQKFTALHLIRRYPLIFGTWRGKVDSEISYISPIAGSLARIIERSPASEFKSKSRRRLNNLRQEIFAAAIRTSGSLADRLNVSDCRDDRDEDMSTEETLMVSMARLLKLSLRPSRTKITALIQPTDEEYDEALVDDWKNLDHLTPNSPMSALLRHDILWNDTPLSAEHCYPESLCDKVDPPLARQNDGKATLPDSNGTEDNQDDDILLHDHEDFRHHEVIYEACDGFSEANDLALSGEDPQNLSPSSPVWDENDFEIPSSQDEDLVAPPDSHLHEHIWSDCFWGYKDHLLASAASVEAAIPTNLSSCANSLINPRLLLEYSEDNQVVEFPMIDILGNAYDNESPNINSPTLDSSEEIYELAFGD